MKNEVEFKWIVSLLNCQYIKGGILRREIGGCKSDFERVASVSAKNKEFRKWLNFLIEQGILEFFEKRKAIGGFVDTYVIVYPRLEFLLNENPIYDSTMNYIKKKNFVLKK